MPHDINGDLLQENDEVVIRAKVKTIQPHAEFCNLTVETLEPMYPSTSPTTIVLNARQVELSCCTDASVSIKDEAPRTR